MCWHIHVWLLALGSAYLPAITPPQTLQRGGEEVTLVFHDEFEGATLNPAHWRSLDYGEGGIKNDTLRGPDNLAVSDGKLQLMVRKETRQHADREASWSAGFVLLREKIEPGTYVESRLRPGRASGINNAFWLAAWGAPAGALRDKYEIDIVETRRDMRKDGKTGRAHLAWHDWKSYAQAQDTQGKPAQIAQGIHIDHDWGEFQTWGFWLGESDFIFYLDGKEVWRGKSHPRYPDQWHTGIGKFDRWFPGEQARMYGHHEQPNWSYRGGFTGDRMNVIFSNLPWHDTWSPLDAAQADGDTMEVDYLRIYRPTRILRSEPDQINIPPGGSYALAADKSLTIPLHRAVDFTHKHPLYFSLEAEWATRSDLRVEFLDASGRNTLYTARVREDGHLEAGLAGSSIKVESRKAYPASERTDPYVTPRDPVVLILRLTPLHQEPQPGEVAFSFSVLPTPLETRTEPFLYRNIDPTGNSGISQGWQLNQRGFPSGGRISAVRITNVGPGEIDIRSFRSGSSYFSVLPESPIPALE